jgi:hypothetical protein
MHERTRVFIDVFIQLVLCLRDQNMTKEEEIQETSVNIVEAPARVTSRRRCQSTFLSAFFFCRQKTDILKGVLLFCVSCFSHIQLASDARPWRGK